jgi:hypothetical protein
MEHAVQQMQVQLQQLRQRIQELQLSTHQQAGPEPMEINHIQKQERAQPFSGKCYTCGRPGHKASQCRMGQRAAKQKP